MWTLFQTILLAISKTLVLKHNVPLRKLLNFFWHLEGFSVLTNLIYGQIDGGNAKYWIRGMIDLSWPNTKMTSMNGRFKNPNQVLRTDHLVLDIIECLSIGCGLLMSLLWIVWVFAHPWMFDDGWFYPTWLICECHSTFGCCCPTRWLNDQSIAYAFLFFGFLFINVVECLIGTSHHLSTYLMMPLPVW
jgi:hypothetical protein